MKSPILLCIACFCMVVVGQSSSKPPTAKFKGSIVCCPLDSVVLDGWASLDVDGHLTQWIWDLNADGQPDSITSCGEIVIRAPLHPKLYLVILRVRDNQGNLSEPDTGIVHVMDSKPTVNVGADDTIKVGTRIFFRPSVVSHCSQMRKFEWDFDGDETFEYQSSEHGNTSRVYHRPGKYRAKFRVTDEFGRQAGGIRTIIVKNDLP